MRKKIEQRAVTLQINGEETTRISTIITNIPRKQHPLFDELNVDQQPIRSLRELSILWSPYYGALRKIFIKWHLIFINSGRLVSSGNPHVQFGKDRSTLTFSEQSETRISCKNYLKFNIYLVKQGFKVPVIRHTDIGFLHLWVSSIDYGAQQEVLELMEEPIEIKYKNPPINQIPPRTRRTKHQIEQIIKKKSKHNKKRIMYREIVTILLREYEQRIEILERNQDETPILRGTINELMRFIRKAFSIDLPSKNHFNSILKGIRMPSHQSHSICNFDGDRHFKWKEVLPDYIE